MFALLPIAPSCGDRHIFLVAASANSPAYLQDQLGAPGVFDRDRLDVQLFALVPAP
jgi:hypothetical protein